MTMYVHMHATVCTCTMCVCVSVQTCIHACAGRHMCVCVCMRMCLYACAYFSCSIHTHNGMSHSGCYFVHMCMCVCACMLVCVCVCVHAHAISVHTHNGMNQSGCYTVRTKQLLLPSQAVVESCPTNTTPESVKLQIKPIQIATVRSRDRKLSRFVLALLLLTRVLELKVCLLYTSPSPRD